VLENLGHELGDENQLVTFKQLVKALEGDDSGEVDGNDSTTLGETIRFNDTSRLKQSQSNASGDVTVSPYTFVSAEDTVTVSSYAFERSFATPSAAAGIPTGVGPPDSKSSPAKALINLRMPTPALIKPALSQDGVAQAAAFRSKRVDAAQGPKRSGQGPSHQPKVPSHDFSMSSKSSDVFANQADGAQHDRVSIDSSGHGSTGGMNQGLDATTQPHLNPAFANTQKSSNPMFAETSDAFGQTQLTGLLSATSEEWALEASQGPSPDAIQATPMTRSGGPPTRQESVHAQSSKSMALPWNGNAAFNMGVPQRLLDKRLYDSFGCCLRAAFLMSTSDLVLQGACAEVGQASHWGRAWLLMMTSTTSPYLFPNPSCPAPSSQDLLQP
jgi:hypothetical protein